MFPTTFLRSLATVFGGGMPPDSSHSTASYGLRANRWRRYAGSLVARLSTGVRKTRRTPPSFHRPTAPAASTQPKRSTTYAAWDTRSAESTARSICGERVEHELGWRAQFAYPKSLFLPPDLIPSDTKEMESRLEALAAYSTDIFIVGGGQSIPLCRRGAGFDAAGLDYLIGKRTQYYARRQRDRTLMRGDRVAVPGRGIAVVEYADDTEVHAVLWNTDMVRIGRREIVWDERHR